MPGMWELPEIAGTDETATTVLTVRYSITVTDYVVRVLRGPAPTDANGRWVRSSHCSPCL